VSAWAFYAKKNEGMNNLERIFEKKMQVYFTLKELVEVTGLHYNSLKKRMKKLKSGKYKDVQSAIMKEGRSYRIHLAVIADFMPQRSNKNRKKPSFYQELDFQCAIVLNPNNKYYDSAIFHTFIEHIKADNPSVRLKYTVEDSYTKKGQNMHINILCDYPFFDKTDSFRRNVELFFDKSDIYACHPKNVITFDHYMQKARINY
jgi:hypothetical protein